MVSGSVAVSAGSVAVSVAGAGSTTENKVAVQNKAYIQNSGITTGDVVKAANVKVNAKDYSTIDAYAGAASLSAAFGFTGSAAVSLGSAVALNTIDNEVQASIVDVDQLQVTGDVPVAADGYIYRPEVTRLKTAGYETTVNGQRKWVPPVYETVRLNPAYATNSGNLTVLAESEAVLTGTVQMAAVAASFGGVAVAGGGAVTTNSVLSSTEAFLRNGTTTVNGDVKIAAYDKSTVTSLVDAIAVSVGIGLAASGAKAESVVEVAVSAKLDNARLNATNVVVEATSTPRAISETRAVNAGAAAVGVSFAKSRINNMVSAEAGGPDIRVNTLRVTAAELVTTNTYAADAKAQGLAGGLIGADATITEATSTSVVTALMTAGSVINAVRSVGVAAQNDSRQRAVSDSIAFGLAAVGATKAKALSAATTSATVGSGSTINAGSLNIQATGTDDNFAKATPGSVGALAIAAADLDTSATASTIAKLGNNTTVRLTRNTALGQTGQFSLTADHLTRANTQLQTSSFGLLAGTGASGDNLIDSVVLASVGNAADVKAAAIQVLASNRFEKVALAGKNIDGTAAALLAGAGATSKTDLQLVTMSLIHDNAKLEVEGTSDNAGAFTVRAVNNIFYREDIAYKSGGLGSGVFVRGELDTSGSRTRTVDGLTLTLDDLSATVRLGDNAASGNSNISLKSAGNIELSANTHADAEMHVSVDNYGGVTVSIAQAVVNLRPVNSVVVGRGSTIKALRDVNLLAGMNSAFAHDNYRVRVFADTFAGSVIPLGDVVTESLIFQQNLITVHGDSTTRATISAGGNVRLYADKSPFGDITAQGKAVNWASAVGDALDKAMGGKAHLQTTGTAKQDAHAIITNNGRIETGANRKIDLTITGIDANGKVTYSGVGTDGVTVSVVNREQQSAYFDELDAAYEALREYSNNVKLRDFYNSEITRLTNLLKSQQLAVERTAVDGDGNVIYKDGKPVVTLVPVRKTVATIVVAPIFASAGYIDLRSDVLQGSGIIDAPSDVSVKIDNTSRYAMEIQGVTIPEDTGGIFFNGFDKRVLTNSNVTTQNSSNVSKENSDGIRAGEPNLVAGTASFSLNPSQPTTTGGDPIVIIKNSIASLPTGVTIWPKLSVTGAIDAINAHVTLDTSNGQGDILVNAPVDAKTLQIKTNGLLVIDLPPGSVLHTGGNPYTNWTEGTDGMSRLDDNTVSAKIDARPTLANAIMAGQISITAEYINLNGLIQSGSATYQIDINSDVSAEIETIKRGLADGSISGGLIELTKAGGVGFKAFWDSENNRVVLQEFRTPAGSITITGKLMNTGNGEIKALGGYTNIVVNNNTAHNVVVKRIDVSERGTGKIVLNDRSKGAAPGQQRTDGGYVRTTYLTNADGTTSKLVEDFIPRAQQPAGVEGNKPSYSNGMRINPNVEAVITNNLGSNFGYSGTYQITQGWRYGWSVAMTERESVKTTYGTAAWLGIDWLAADPGNVVKVEREALTQPTLVEGSDYFYIDTANTQRYDFISQKVTTSSQTREGNKWEVSTWYGKTTYYQEIIVESDNRTTATHTIEADRNVTISMIGNTTANVTITSTGSGSVIIEGGILNTTGKTEIVSNADIVASGDALVQGANIVLQARGNIGAAASAQDGEVNAGALKVDIVDQFAVDYRGNTQATPTNGKLSASSTNGSIFLHEVNGNLTLGTVSASKGEVFLSTKTGNIIAADKTTTLITANTLTMVANGSIGTQTDDLRINSSATATGLVNLSATGDIAVIETIGDLTLQKAKSTGGRVEIEILSGSLLDGDSFVERDLRAEETLRNGLWKDLQLTSGAGAAQKAEQAVQNYENYKRGEYAQYWKLRANVKNGAYVLSAAEEAYLRANGSGDSAIATLQQSRYQQYLALHDVYGVYGDVYRSDINVAYNQYWTYKSAGSLDAAALADYDDLRKMFDRLGETSKNASFAYLFTDAALATSMRAGVKVWTEQELLNAFGAGLTKRVTDTEVVKENANIEGKSVWIKASQVIGSVQVDTVINFSPGTQKQLSDAERIALAAAERQDIVYLSEYATGVNVNFGLANVGGTSMGTITRPGGNWDGYQAGSLVYIKGNTQHATEDGAYYVVHSVSGSTLNIMGVFNGKAADASYALYNALGVFNPLSTQIDRISGFAAELGRTVAVGEVIENPMDAGKFSTTYSAGAAVTGSFGNGGFYQGTITLGAGDVAKAGVVAGSKIYVHGTSSNATRSADSGAAKMPDYYEVASVVGDVITLKTGQLLTTELGANVQIGLVTITQVTPPPVLKAIIVDRREDLDVSVEGQLDAEAKAVYIGSEQDLNLGQIKAGTFEEDKSTGQIRLKTSGNISNVLTSGVNLLGRDILIEAGQGQIGNSSKAVTVSHLGTTTYEGGLIARAKSSIWMSAPTTDLRVESVFSSEGDVFLSALNKSIVDALGGDGAKIVARHVSLSAVNGSIGSLGSYLDIDITSPLQAAGSALDQANVGTIIANARNDIYLNETDGDLNVRGIVSTHGNVGLDALTGSIIDAEYAVPGMDGEVVRLGADIIGNSVTLNAYFGIGAPGQELEINSSAQAAGIVTAYTDFGSIYLTETAGHLNLFQAGSGMLAGPTFTFLTALSGSILNARATTEADKRNIVSGKTYLVASLDVGASGNRIVSGIANVESWSKAGSTWIHNLGGLEVGGVNAGALFAARSGGSINISAASPITVSNNNYAATGDINITAGEDNDVDNPATPENEAIADNVVIKKDVVLEAAAGSINITAGDDVHIEDGAKLTAKVDITINADLGTVDGTATTVKIEGDLRAQGKITFQTGNGNDTILIEKTALLLGNTFIKAGDGNDKIVIDQLASMITYNGVDVLDGTDANTARDFARDPVTGRLLRDRLTIDGEGGTDHVLVNVNGASDYVLTVSDSGAGHDGVDVLQVEGLATADTFLLRHNFIAHLRDNGAGGYQDAFERINYDASINGRVIVNANAGDDKFFVDDNAAILTLDGGAGNDAFQVGQVFSSKRDTFDVILSQEDQFKTIETTLGHMSYGITLPAVMFGGIGDDIFTIYSNHADLRLEGEDGNDTFIIRAFALAQGINVKVNGGTGDDVVQYNINAPVDIDGGAGFDKVVVLGTELDDVFVVTKDGIYGAGLTVRVANAEAMEVDGLEGDDTFYVLSTDANVVTTIIGGLGSDTFNIAGDVVDKVVSDDNDGDRGIISHTVSSLDPAYAGLFVRGIDFVAKGGTTAAIDLGNGLKVRENAAAGSALYKDDYTISLPGAYNGHPAFVTVSAAQASAALRNINGKTVLVSLTGNDGDWHEALTITFDNQNWTSGAKVYVKAEGDTAHEGTLKVAISHTVISADKAVDGFKIQNALVTVVDDDKPAIIINETGNGTSVTEGTTAGSATGGSADTYTVELSKPPAAGEIVTVVVGLPASGQLTADRTSIRFGAVENLTAEGGPIYAWNSAQIVTLTSLGDNTPENRASALVTHTVTSSLAGSDFDNLPDGYKEQILVDIVDSDSASVEIIETEGSTVVSQSHQNDSYQIKLSTRPTHEVRVGINVDGKAKVLVSGNVFADGKGGYYALFAAGATEAVTVNLQYDETAQGNDSPFREFAVQPHDVGRIAGPLIIEGGAGTQPRTITRAVALPDEVNVPLTVVVPPAGQEDLDTLNVYTDTATTGMTGKLTATTINGLGMGGGLPPITADMGNGAAKTFDRGITYTGLHVVEVLLGQGDDTFTIESTALDTMTVVHGGGGSDTLKVKTHDASGAKALGPIVLFGDTSADGSRYSSTLEKINGQAFHFSNPGNDTIDASDALGIVVIDGGRGSDTLIGGQSTNFIAGGVGNDTITGAAQGKNWIIGDSAFSIDYRARTVSIDTSATIAVPNGSNGDLSGDDTITGGNKSNVIIGDHGTIQQDRLAGEIVDRVVGVLDMMNDRRVVLIKTVGTGGGNDTIHAGDIAGADPQDKNILIGGVGNDVLKAGLGSSVILGDNGEASFTAGVVTAVRSTDTSVGGEDDIDVLNGTHVIMGGFGKDTIDAGQGGSIILGDSGEAIFTNGGVTTVRTIAAEIGSDDRITILKGEHVIMGGAGADIIKAGEGGSVILGDSGEASFSSGKVTEVFSIAADIGGADSITVLDGTHVIMGGMDADTIDAGTGSSVILGDSGRAKFTETRALISVVSIATDKGGDDQIKVLDGEHVIMGGFGSDTINAGKGGSIILGDSGEAFFTNGKVTEVSSISPEIGGADSITVLDGKHVIIGGMDADTIDAGTGSSVILGDSGKALFTEARAPDQRRKHCIRQGWRRPDQGARRRTRHHGRLWQRHDQCRQRQQCHPR
ncbi:calcium-binding protein [Devosia aurantiaca]|uniref:Uncharacterized protein n=1 Tax=Devosia aurantiaca TaxID=2714858 RepID=A0A6M1SPH5_9HYPH|nr:calcium-binding protein [Devosia aurantiaca]NGP18574.1 hypothetical protein [Devosia aurantiaca]